MDPDPNSMYVDQEPFLLFFLWFIKYDCLLKKWQQKPPPPGRSAQLCRGHGHQRWKCRGYPWRRGGGRGSLSCTEFGRSRCRSDPGWQVSVSCYRLGSVWTANILLAPDYGIKLDSGSSSSLQLPPVRRLQRWVFSMFAARTTAINMKSFYVKI